MAELQYPHAFKFKSLSPPNIDVIGAVKQIIQGPQGFMWFAGESGLARYDGYKLKIFFADDQDPNSISDTAINSIYVDSKQRFWVGTFRGVDRYDSDLEQFIHYPLGDQEVFVTSVVERASGEIWVSSFGGVYWFDEASNRFRRFSDGVITAEGQLSRRFYSMREDLKQRLWLGSERGVSFFDTDSGEHQYYHQAQAF
ncbi:MAG: hypothetical protein COA42_12625, partial [Alteromonadaceae bacterium]